MIFSREFSEDVHSLRGVICNPDGTSAGGLFAVNLSNRDVIGSSVATTNDGYVVVWEEKTANGDTEVYFGGFGSAGPLDAQPVLIDSTGSINSDIHVAGLKDGGFTVAYTDNGWNNSVETEITARVYNADGSARSGFQEVNSSLAGNQAKASITALANGASWSAFPTATVRFSRPLMLKVTLSAATRAFSLQSSKPTLPLFRKVRSSLHAQAPFPKRPAQATRSGQLFSISFEQPQVTGKATILSGTVSRISSSGVGATTS